MTPLGPVELDGLAANAALLIGRLLFAAMFVASAVDKFRGDPKEVEMIARLHLPAPARLEKLTGLCEVLGAAMLAFGFWTSLGAFALSLFVAFTTAAFLRYWTVPEPPEARQSLRNAFFANWAVVGGLLFVVVFGPGSWALDYGLR